ncbi:MAG: transporter substrate-binding domain-containing protein [Burkholderiaceae bacterium]|nr:transporter substrate-binding domain-containing protein [Burkholderiaceae bacterium]
MTILVRRFVGRLAALLGSLICCACFTVSAVAADAQTIKLVTGNYPPYEYEEDGDIKGMAVTLINEAARRCNIAVKIQVVPWARALREAEEGLVDGVFSAIMTPERKQKLNFTTQPIVPLMVSIFVKRGSPVKYDGHIAKLRDYRIGILNQFSNGVAFDDAVKSGTLKNIDVVDNADLNVKKLMAGRIDLMVNNTYGAYFLFRKYGIAGDVVELLPPLDNSPAFIAFTKKRDMNTVRNAFDNALVSMKKDGTYQRIVASFARE